jgi:GAF domain-containing protein
MRAPDPANEVERLKALREYAILDTKPERSYDDLIRLAAAITGCPTAVVSLVDAQRQWFKACVGQNQRETSRDISFCAHAILRPNEPLIVPDAHKDPRFADNANVRGDPFIRFYAGIPLLNPTGLALGTLCVMDRVPRELSAEQMTHLTALAAQVTHVLELRRVSSQLARALEEVKTLEGLLPICCQCKSIRSDEGEWLRLEGYVMARTPAKFTHGFCPDCAKKLYPEFV